MCWWEAREVPEIRTEILSPAVSPISQRRPDYIKSLNPDFRPKPAVQVLSRGKGGGGGKKKKPSKIYQRIRAALMTQYSSPFKAAN